MDARVTQYGRSRRAPVTIGLAVLSCLLLVGVSYQFVDRPIADWSHAVIRRPDWAWWLTKLADIPDPLAIVSLICLGAFYLWRHRFNASGRIVLEAALATLAATILVIILKDVFGRTWPETWVHNNPSWISNHAYGFNWFKGGRGYESFPSGHTTRITAPFAVLWHRLPRWRPLWLVPVIAVVVGLVACNFHFLSDCIAGIYLGAASAALVLALV